MTRSAFAALLLLLSLAAPAAAQQKRLFFKSTTAKTASPAVQNLDSHVVAELGRALMDKYPCMEQASYDAVATELSAEADKAKRGDSDDNALGRIGSKLNSDYTVLTQVAPLGGGYAVLITVLDTRTTRTVFKQSTQVPRSSAVADAGAAAERAAQGISLPACPPSDWSGTVVLSEQYSGSAPTDDGKKTISGTRSLSMNCKLDGMNGSEATCSVTYSSKMNISDGSYINESGQQTVTCSIGVDSDASGTRLVVGSIRLKTTQSARMVFKDDEGKGETVTTSGPTEAYLGGWEFKGPPAPAGGKSFSGSGTWGDAKATWTLRPPAGY